MDPQTFRNILAALETVHSGLSSNDVRRAAQEYLDNAKSSADASFAAYCVHRGNGQDEIVRHFGLHVLDQIVRFRWNAMDLEAREKLKQIVLELVSSGLLDLLRERTFVKEKLSQTLAELAKRDWPQRWPNFHDILIQNLHAGGIQAEISLITLRSLTDDIFNYQEDVDETRRSDMLGGITASLPIFMPTLMEFLVTHVQRMKAAPPKSVDELVFEKLATSTLATLTSFLDWIPLTFIRDTHAIKVLCSLLLEPPLRGKAVECLLVLVSRKVKPEERDFLLPLFDHLDFFLTVLQATDVNTEEVDGDNYVFQKRVCQVLVDLGMALLLGKTSRIPAAFPSYVKILLVFAGHPSHMISSFVVPFWIACFKAPNVLETVAFQEALPSLLQISATKVVKVGDPEQGNSPSCRYSLVDFETGAEFRRFFSVFRNRTLEIVRSISDLRPLETARFIQQSVVEYITTMYRPGEKVTVHHQGFLIWEARTTLLESVFTSLKPKVFETDAGPGLIAVLNETLATTLTFQPLEQLLLTRSLTCYQAFFVLFEVNRDLMAKVLETIFSLVTFTLPTEPKVVDEHWSLSEDSLAVRRKACSSLVRYGMNIAHLLLPLFQPFWGLIQDLFAKNLVTSGEKTFLIEFLTLLSNAAPNAADRLAFLTTVADPLCRELEACSYFSSLPVFFESTGIQLLAQIASDTKRNPGFQVTEEMRRVLQKTSFARRQLYFLANTFYVLLKRVNVAEETKHLLTKGEEPAPHPLGAFMPRLLSPTLALVRLIHSLWNVPHSWAGIPLTPEMHAILSMSETERALLLGEELASVLDDETFSNVFVMSKEVRKMRVFLGTIRDACYNLLGQMCFSGNSFYGIPGLSALIIDNIFSAAPTIESRHLRVLDHVFVKPFLTKSPTAHLEAAFARFIPAYFTFMTERLSKEWSGFKVVTETRQEDEDRESESEEIVAEKILRDLTRGLSEILLAVFNPRHALDGVAAETLKAGSEGVDLGANKLLVNYVLLHKREIAEPVMHTVICAFAWRDTVHIRRVVSVCLAIIPQVTTSEYFQQVIADALLRAALQNLNDGYFQEVHTDVISLITHIYLRFRSITDLPRKIFLALPNMTPEKLRRFDEAFAKEKAEKKHRLLMKSFLQEVTGKNIGSWFKDKVSILSLPEKLFINRLQPTAAQPDDAQGADIGLFEFFNTAKNS